MNQDIGKLIVEYQVHHGDEMIALDLLEALVEERRYLEAIEMLKVIRLYDIEFHLMEIKESLGMKEEPAQAIWQLLGQIAQKGL